MVEIRNNADTDIGARRIDMEVYLSIESRKSILNSFNFNVQKKQDDEVFSAQYETHLEK